MAESTRLNLGTARLVHLSWALGLESMVANPKSAIDIDSYQDCELGRWIQTTALQTLGDFDATHLLIRTHQHFHESAAALSSQIVRSREESRSVDKALFAQEMDDVHALSRDIVYNLTELELGILERRHKQRLLTHPIESLFQRIFVGPYTARSDDQGPLNVSHARLIHLNWANTLSQAFRGWGRDARLESEEDCALGDWLRTAGVLLGAKHVVIGRLKAAHVEYHLHVAETICALQSRREKAAQRGYTKTLELSREIVYLLSVLEFRLLESGGVVREESFSE